MRSFRFRHRLVRGLPLLLVGPLLSLSLALPLSLLAQPGAGAADGPWLPGPTPSQTTYPLVVSGTTASYSVNLGGGGVSPQEWSFGTTATESGTVPVGYTYTGFHAYFEVTVHLTAFVTHLGVTTTTPIVNAGPVDCCNTPSGGFSYNGTFNFNVAVGDSYGFLFGGSNFDSNSVLTGTVTLTPQPPMPIAAPSTATENLSWTNAADLPPGTTGIDGTLTAQGEARWYKFPVTPGGQVEVDLSGLSQNYDLTMYSDIGAEFTTISAILNQPNALATLGAQSGTNTFAPSIYSPSIYSPSIYSPSIYSPSIYSPSIYSPSIYSPSIYSPSIYSPSIYSPSIYSPSIYSPSPAFLQAFSSAQADSLVGVSANDGNAPESIRTPTWNDSGSFYVRVQGRNGAFGSSFHLALTVIGGTCSGVPLNSFTGDPTIAGTPGVQTVILTDSTRVRDNSGALMNPTELATFMASLGSLATQTNGVVVDISTSTKITELRNQAAANVGCVPAMNLEAQAIRDVVNGSRDGSGTLKYVVLAGGDSVIPYFRYADNAGMGPESDFIPPVQLSTASQASLAGDYVLNQDAYGALSDLQMKNLPLPIPDLAVGRLVETDSEIEGQITEFLRINGALPTPSSSLVTGYDFLTSAADSVAADFAAGAPGTNDQLITNQGVPTTTTTPPVDRSHSWTATDLANALLTKHHDLVFLAGHFNAETAEAADYTTSLSNTQLNATLATGGVLKDSLVFSAGCHSGYNLLNNDGLPANPVLDWPEEMARQKATFIAGTGYQYADTVTLSYSAWLYAQFAKELRAGSGPVAVGQALLKAKQDYLNSVATFGGMDQKALLESALYGLPMATINMPGARIPVRADTTQVASTNRVVTGPGAQLGLSTFGSLSAPLTESPVLTSQSQASLNPDGVTSGPTLHWYSGPDGTETTPGLPVLPKASDDVTDPVTDGSNTLRGVALLSGTYTDTTGVTPLTGAPTTEQNGVHTTFSSPTFFPQKLFNINYFGALGPSGNDPRTRLVTTPVQYRVDAGGAATDTERAYSQLGFKLYYSSNTQTYAGGFTPALAAPPGFAGVSGVVSADLSHVDVSAHVTGDPSAGIQEAWLTYSGEAGPFHGSWQSIALTQDANDSTLWTGTLPLPPSQNYGDVRFILQAADGVGLVGMDTALGDGYTPALPPAPAPLATTTTFDATNPSSANLGDTVTIGATTSAPGGSTITLSLGNAAVPVVTDPSGHGAATFILRDGVGSFVVTASYAGDGGHIASFATSSLTVAPTPTTLTITSAASAPVLVAHLATGAGVALGQQPVAFTFGGTTVYRVTDSNGDAHLGPVPGLVNGVYAGSASFTPASTPANPATLSPSTTAASFTNNTTGPGVSATSLTPPSITVGQSTTLTATVADDGTGIAGAEYFIGPDPGQGSGTSVAVTAGAVSTMLGSSLAAGSYTVSLRAVDLYGDWSAVRTATLKVTGPLDHLVLSTSTPTITTGASASYRAEGWDAFGNDLGDVTAATTFTITPTGACAGASCGATTGGVYTVTGTDAGKTGVATLTVNQAPAITTANAVTFTVGTAGLFTANATGYPVPTFSESGTLPTGVTLSPAGVLSGTPAAGSGGVYPITVTASNGVNPAANQSFTLTVNQPPGFVSGTPPTTAYVGQNYSAIFLATGTPAPTYALSGAPSWLSINTTSGLVSGVPPKGTTSFSYRVLASNGVGLNATVGPFTVTVSAASAAKADLSVTLSCPSTGKRGATVTCTVKVRNAGPYTALNVVTAVVLPANLTKPVLSAGGKNYAGVELWTAASLASGSSQSYTVTATVSKVGVVSIPAVTVSSNADPNLLDNVAIVKMTLTT